MTTIRSSSSAIDRMRETLVVGLIAICVGLAVYTFLGVAWTVKIAVEKAQMLRHPFKP